MKCMFVCVVNNLFQISTFHYFLVEAQITVASSVLGVKMKCDNPSQSDAFMKHFQNSLVGKWIAQH